METSTVASGSRFTSMEISMEVDGRILTAMKLSGSFHGNTRACMGRRWWAGPGSGWADPSIFDMMGRGPARPIKF